MSAPRAEVESISPDSTRAITIRQIPRGVWDMASTELWERFSFYGLQAILAFYLLYSLADGGLDLGAAASSGVVGAYGGAVYLAQLAGAWFGERVMSPKRCVLWGGIVITAGHIVLAVLPDLAGLFMGLVLIVIGTGTLKTNITSLVGFLLDDGDGSRRDVGFAYFYMAIGLGAVLGPFVTGFVQNEWGFHWGFGLAAVGMLAAVIQYGIGMKHLPAEADAVREPLPARRLALIGACTLVGAALVWTVFATELVEFAQLSAIVTTLILIAAAVYFIVILSSRRITSDERSRVAGYLPLFLAAGLYFGLLFQQFTSIAILITERVDLAVGSWSFPVAWITMASPLALVLVTPLMARLWGRSGNRGPGPAAKFACGLVQIGAAYAIVLATTAAAPEAAIPLLLMVAVMLIAGSSEVFVGPISLSLATKIGPPAFRLHLVGLNFLTLALGSSISGLLGLLFAVLPHTPYFVFVTLLGAGFGVVLWCTRGPIERALQRGL